MSDHRSVVEGMGTATWSSEDGTAYEVALEGVNHLVGAYARLIAEAESAEDPERVAALVAQQRRWASRRKTLSPADRGEVDAVTTECARPLAELRGAA